MSIRRCLPLLLLPLLLPGRPTRFGSGGELPLLCSWPAWVLVAGEDSTWVTISWIFHDRRGDDNMLLCMFCFCLIVILVMWNMNTHKPPSHIVTLLRWYYTRAREEWLVCKMIHRQASLTLPPLDLAFPEDIVQSLVSGPFRRKRATSVWTRV